MTDFSFFFKDRIVYISSGFCVLFLCLRVTTHQHPLVAVITLVLVFGCALR